MIRSITVEALDSGKTVTLVLASPEDSQGIAITKVDGLGPGMATLNDSEWVTVDGSHENSVRLPARVINLNLRFVPTTYDESVADIRRKTYAYFPIKKKVRLTFEFADFRVLQTVRKRWIEGTVKQNDTGPWSEEEGATISIHCADPYFKDVNVEEVNLSQIIPVFHFTFPDQNMNEHCPESNFIISEKLNLRKKDVENHSALDVGGVFIMEAFGTVVNPQLINFTTGEVFELDYTMQAGEVITIDTRSGHKRVYTNDGYDTSRIQYLSPNSKWIHLQAGKNTIGYEAYIGVDNLHLMFTTTPIYEGV